MYDVITLTSVEVDGEYYTKIDGEEVKVNK